MKISIDPGAGPCFGVQKAIDKAEEVLKEKSQLVCMGDLIHNEAEISRLSQLGMLTSSLDEVLIRKPEMVLFRAHGEPPESYQLMKNNNIHIIDASCPIVLNLQQKIRQTWEKIQGQTGQIIIYGQANHAEVISLLANCNQEAIIIESPEEVSQIDVSVPIYLFSQTTKYRSVYLQIRDMILDQMRARGIDSSHLYFHDSSCKIVARRDEQLREFVKDKDVILFVSGSKSSNGKQLFQICKSLQPNSYFISSLDDLKPEMILHKAHIGISGATSSPKWLLESVANRVEAILQED